MAADLLAELPGEAHDAAVDLHAHPRQGVQYGLVAQLAEQPRRHGVWWERPDHSKAVPQRPRGPSVTMR